MEDQIRWYLMVSALFAAPAFALAAAQWWGQNKGIHDPVVSVTRMGILIAALSAMPLTIFLAFTTHYPLKDNSTLRVGSRWSGLLFALIALVCGLRGRGWMRFVLAAFSAWLLFYSFWLLGPNA